jgi:hypothetical protein
MPGRSSRQCKDRWVHYLAPDIIVAGWSSGDDALLLKKVDELGRKWRQIEPFFTGRPDISLKNRYNVLMRKQQKRLKLKSRIPHEIEETIPQEWPVDSHINEWQPNELIDCNYDPLGWGDPPCPDWFYA